MNHILIGSVDQLREALGPVHAGEVRRMAADTETTEVTEGRFTPWGTSVRMAGFSLSYDWSGDTVDLYVPIRHVPYDFRRPARLIDADVKHRGRWWLEQLDKVERVLFPPDGIEPEAEAAAWKPGWQAGCDPNVDAAGALELLQEVLRLPGIEWWCHNLAFDAKIFERDGLELPWEELHDSQLFSVFTDPRYQDAWDTKLNAWVHGGHGLKHLGERWCGIAPDAQELLKLAMEALGVGSSRLEDFSMLPLRTAIAPYACMDTRLVLDFVRVAEQRAAAKDERAMAMYDVYRRELRHSTAMERTGMRVAVDRVPGEIERKEGELEALRLRITEVAGRPLPLGSPANLAEILYGELGFPRYRNLKDTKKGTLKQIRGRLAAGTDVMAATSPLSSDKGVDLLNAILAWRKAEKLVTSFYRPLGRFGEDGTVHPVLRTCQARTTRYSASAPNIQQVPKPDKGEEHESPRMLFVPREGHVFTTLDYSQIELRLAAHYSVAIPQAFEYVFSWKCTLKRRGDCKGRGTHGEDVRHYGRKNISSRGQPVLYDGFMTGDPNYDPHQRMADVSGRPRGQAKAGNFALLYGAFPNKLAETLDISVRDAQALFKTFWEEAYPELGHLRSFVDERLRKGGKQTAWSHQEFIRTLHGAHIYLEDGYKGLNYVIQRSAREVLAIAINDVGEYFEREVPSYRIVAPVHDELIIEHPADELDRGVIQRTAQIMVEAGAASRVPMLVGPELCREDWAHKEPLDGWGWNGVLQQPL